MLITPRIPYHTSAKSFQLQLAGCALPSLNAVVSMCLPDSLRHKGQERLFCGGGEACRCGLGDTFAMCTRPPAPRPAFSQPTWCGEPWSTANSPGGPLPQPETPPNTLSCAQQAPVLSSSPTTPCRLLTALGPGASADTGRLDSCQAQHTQGSVPGMGWVQQGSYQPPGMRLCPQIRMFFLI